MTVNTNGLGLGANVTNFPLLVRFTAAAHKDMLDSAATQILANGADIRVTKADGVTDIPFEIERAATGAGGTLALWVKADQVTANSAAGFVFRVYWGKAGATTASNGGAVFDTANGYQAVFHLNDLNDATKNAYVATATGTTLNTADAIIGAARTFGTSSGGISDATTATNFLSFAPGATHKLSTHTGPITMEAWVRSSITSNSNTSAGNKTIVSHRSGAQEVAWLKRSGASPNVYSAGGDTTNANGPYVPTGEANAWHYVVGTWDGTAWTVIRQRTSEAWGLKSDNSPTVIRTVGGGGPGASTNPWFIGGMSSDGTTAGTVTRGWQGQIDEVRISTVARDTNYLKLTFETSKQTPTAISIGATETPTPPAGGVYAGWTGYRDIVLNTSAAGANVTGTVTNFPVLVRLGTAEASILGAANNGNSIRFSKSDTTTVLPYYIESWSPTAAAIWVKVDTIYGNNSTQKIRLYWGKNDAADQSNGAAVFDTTNGYNAVWNMSGTTGETDATGSGLNATATGTVGAAAGLIGGARSFNGNAANYLTVPNSASSKLNYAPNMDYTLSAWVYADSITTATSNGHGILNKGNDQYGLGIYGNNSDAKVYDIMTRGSSTWNQAASNGVTAISGVKTWRLVTGTWKGSGTPQDTARIYVNGQLVNTTFFNDLTTPGDRNETFNVFIGALGGSSVSRPFIGRIDHVTASSVVRDSNWIKLTYANQQATNTLVNIGLPVLTAPGQPTAVTAVAGDAQATVSWTAPANDGGSPITGYRAHATQDASKFCTTTGALSCVVTTLSNNTTYTFVVRAINAIDTGAPSTASNQVTPNPPAASGAYSAWTGHRTIVVNTSATGAKVNATVTNFPVLVRLNSAVTEENTILSQGGTNGANIRFSKMNDSTALPYQIESWSSTAAAIWVKLDTILGNNSTQSFRLHYNNANATTSESNASAVFDTTQFTAVYHMNDNANQSDATGRAANLATASAAAPTALAASIIGAGKKFNGSTQWYQIGTDSTALNLNTNNGPYALSAWVRPVGCSDGRIAAISKYSNSDAGGRQFALHTANTSTTWRFTNGAPDMATAATPAEFVADAPEACQDGVWQHVVGVYRAGGTPTADSAANAKIYINGVLVASGTTSSVAAAGLSASSSKAYIGRISTDERYMNGDLDEVRVSRVYRDSNWVRLNYENQKPQNTLVNIGNAPLSVPGAPTGVTGVAGAKNSGAITVSWTAPADNGGSAITGYKAMTSPDTSKSCTTTGATTCNVTGLNPGQAYTFVVKAINAQGASAASAASAAITAPVPVNAGPLKISVNNFSRAYTFVLTETEALTTEKLTMTISDVYGRRVWDKTISPAESKVLTWNGTANNGSKVGTGVYIVRVKVLPSEGKATTATQVGVKLRND